MLVQKRPRRCQLYRCCVGGVTGRKLYSPVWQVQELCPVHPIVANLVDRLLQSFSVGAICAKPSIKIMLSGSSLGRCRPAHFLRMPPQHMQRVFMSPSCVYCMGVWSFCISCASLSETCGLYLVDENVPVLGCFRSVCGQWT